MSWEFGFWWYSYFKIQMAVILATAHMYLQRIVQVIPHRERKKVI